MPKAKDYTGIRYGSCVMLRFYGHDEQGRRLWKAKCDCGNEFVARPDHMKRAGHCVTCGRKNQAKAISKHGDYKNPLYAIWQSMRQRCQNPKAQEFHDYGGRGICVCDEWNDWQAFKAWAMANNYKKGLSIERIDVNGNYEPGNCKWIPLSEQGFNKRNSHLITYNGKTQSIAKFAKEYGFRTCVLERRIYRGWTVERALTTPLQTQMIHR